MRKLGFMRKIGFIIGIIVLLIGVMPMGDGLAVQAAEPDPDDPDWYWKAGNLTDYAMSGMPDFDQKQDNWTDDGTPTGNWSYCGPVAVANSMWWFDSRAETGGIPPPNMSDNYPLVTNYSAPWDDHDPQNVIPLVDDLAMLMNTGPTGTNVNDMQKGIDQFLVNAGLYGYYYEKTVERPNFSWIKAEVERSEDVILLLGFWQGYEYSPGMWEWWRAGGHYVTCAGVNTNTSKRWIAISDPFFDNAEAGGPGRVPVPHNHTANGTGTHNDTQYVSHDMYNVTWDPCPGGNWSLENYTLGKPMPPEFQGQNWGPNLTQYQGAYLDPIMYPIHTQIDYAVAVSPKPDLNEDIDSDYNLTETNVTIRVHVTNETLNNTIYDMDVLLWSSVNGTLVPWPHFDFQPPLQYCKNYTFNVSFGFFPPEEVVLHFSNETGQNIGFAFSYPYEELPDLVVVDKGEDVEGCLYWVDYTVQNVGNGPAGNSTTCIYADGKQVATRPCPSLLAGEFYTDSVGPLPCPGNTTVWIGVEADNYNDVIESNEDNNYYENLMYQPLEFGDAPDPTYPSLLASDGARHCPTDTECLGLNFSMGDWKDFELDARVTDLDIPYSDGLVTPFIVANDPAATVAFEVTNFITTDNLIVNILIDLNIDGDWIDAGEHVVQNQAIPLPGPDENTFVSTPFSTMGASLGPTWLRLTLTRTPVTVPWDGTGLFDCGETEDWNITIVEEVPEEWYYKPNQTDYAPSGMPDFDQKQDLWQNPPGIGPWTYCGPVAVANSLWWFDSREETGGNPPPAISDSYGLVTNYSQPWDDHNASNVQWLVNDLAWYMDTDGQRTMIPHNGTDVFDMQQGIRDYLNATGYNDSYYEHTEQWPNFYWIEEEVERCQDVILLLGFYHNYDGYYEHIGGHYVTCAGVNSPGKQIGISDPYFDNAEAGGAGRVPVAHNHTANGTGTHNDTQYVSHDSYTVVQIFPLNMPPPPPGCWALQNYPVGTNPPGVNITNFIGQNGGPGAYNPGWPVETIIEYAVAVSPVAAVNATLEGQVDFWRKEAKGGSTWVTPLVVQFFNNTTGDPMGWSPINRATDAYGNFTIDGIPPGTYDIGIKNYTCLSKMAYGKAFTAGNVTFVNFGTPIETDIDNNDWCEGHDYNGPFSNFGARNISDPTGWATKELWKCDFYKDEWIEGHDYNQPFSNFGQRGDVFYYTH